jgi:uncharacterized repeat protein (TIGR03803 family)
MTRISKFAVTLLATIIVSAATYAHAQYSVLYNFGSRSGDGGEPRGVLAQGEDGSLYGTTSAAGAYGGGTVFKITPQGQERVLYSFCSLTNCTDGDTPVSGLTLRPDGHFIGTTTGGGSTNAGTIFDVSPTGTLTTLYTFTGAPMELSRCHRQF